MNYCPKCPHCQRQKVKELKAKGLSFEQIKKEMGFKYVNQVWVRWKTIEKYGE